MSSSSRRLSRAVTTASPDFSRFAPSLLGFLEELDGIARPGKTVKRGPTGEADPDN